MKIGVFLKDKLLYIISIFIAAALSVAIIGAFNPVGGPALSILAGLFYILGGFFPLILEYAAKHQFYENLIAIFDQLERKNLIAEMVVPPDFGEGIILYDILRGSNKAMLEEINRYRFRQEEYREYIELWVHEIKTPISSSKLIAQNNPGEAMNSISEELCRIEAFVEQVLFYSRSNNVEKDYLIRKVSLKTLCHDVLRKNAKLFIQRRIGVETENLDYHAYTDTKWLEYILQQLLTNSVKYADKPEAWIKLSACPMENAVKLTVSDNGTGIAANELPRIFDKGFTGTNGRRDERATGMGLYICKKLCDKLGLGLEAESKQGEGASISIILPVSSMTDIG
jgi:signal transduction histidine kinase